MGIFIGFALFLVFIFNILPISQDKVEDQIYEQNDNTATENTQKIEITEEQIYQGNLLLVNSEYAVQQAGIKSDIVKFIYAQRIDEGVWVT
ncbi:truncated carboxypeptidase [Brevibacillus laterosporus GI-9]|nr:truncated carboxypeptidase [Brevibacillus laterosporus GI-9]